MNQRDGSHLAFRIDGPRPGSENMEVDWTTLLRLEESHLPCTIVRFYRWAQPTVSLGKHQRPAEAVNLDYCRERGVPVVSRPTGGRAVFHGDEITYAVVSNNHRLFPIKSIHETYALIAMALRHGLNELGIEVEFSQGSASQNLSPSTSRQKPCFVTSSRHELLCKGRKLVGSAQRRLRRSFLQHGSIALTLDYLEMSQLLGFSEDLVRQKTISLSEAAERPVSFDQAVRFLQVGFEATLH